MIWLITPRYVTQIDSEAMIRPLIPKEEVVSLLTAADSPTPSPAYGPPPPPAQHAGVRGKLARVLAAGYALVLYFRVYCAAHGEGVGAMRARLSLKKGGWEGRRRGGGGPWMATAAPHHSLQPVPLHVG